MKQIPLSQGKFAIVDDEDFEALTRYKWHLTNKGYAARKGYVKEKYKTILMHREIMGVNEASRHTFVDHSDRDTLNNTKDNLRVCSHAQNQWNKAKSDKKTSIYKGVSWDRQYSKWRVSICFGGKTRNLGRFDDELKAAEVFNREAIKCHGEFARINEIVA